MRLIRPTVTILKPDPELTPIKQTYQMIEIAGRTCYKSEDKITDNSAKAFVDMLIDKGHTAMLEHGSIYLAIPVNDKTDTFIYFIYNNQYTEWTRVYKVNGLMLYAITNYRAIFESCMHQILAYQITEKQFAADTLKYMLRRVTVRFICDRGVSHEFVRHRVFSFAQESTRFCNYSKDKFGNELTFILPCWMNSGLVGYYGTGFEAKEKIDHSGAGFGNWTFLYSLIDAEQAYMDQLSYGWTPQQARAVLPNATKTELVMTGTVKQWLGFFKLRCAPNAHPQARELALELKEQFIDENYIAEDDFNNYCRDN